MFFSKTVGCVLGNVISYVILGELRLNGSIVDVELC